MAKEFKEYDKMFKTGKDSDLSQVELEEAKKITKWEFMVQHHTMQTVREAVYLMEDHMDWQEFRVSLKGQSTHVKLYRLAKRYRVAQKLGIWQDIVRVDNYIGALKRGGQLNMNLEIMK